MKEYEYMSQALAARGYSFAARDATTGVECWTCPNRAHIWLIPFGTLWMAAVKAEI